MTGDQAWAVAFLVAPVPVAYALLCLGTTVRVRLAQLVSGGRGR